MSNNQHDQNQNQKPGQPAKPGDNQFQPNQKPDHSAKPATPDNKPAQAKPMEQVKKAQ